MTYQDIWLHGKLVQKGYRSCAPRYQIVRDFCKSHMADGFTVCDIGANMAYFSIRLIEDFRATAAAFEFHQFEKRWAILKRRAPKDLMYINRKVSLNDLRVLGLLCKFDLVLGLSVLHHVPGESDQWVRAMREMGKFVIIEVAMDDSSRAMKKGITIPDGGAVIGYGDSHLQDGFKRPIIAYGEGLI